MSAIPISAQVECVRREIGMRKRVYPRWIASEKMTQAKADAEIAAMEAVLVTLENIQAKERLL